MKERRIMELRETLRGRLLQLALLGGAGRLGTGEFQGTRFGLVHVPAPVNYLRI